MKKKDKNNENTKDNLMFMIATLEKFINKTKSEQVEIILELRKELKKYE